MGTRGYIILHFSGKSVQLYSHFDAYPNGLGANLVREIRLLLQQYSIEEIIKKLSELKIVDYGRDPTEEEINTLTQLAIVEQTSYIRPINDWYWLLRHTQGSLINILNSGYALEASEIDGEYGYDLDFDSLTFTASGHGSYKEFPLESIPEDWINQFQASSDELDTAK